MVFWLARFHIAPGPCKNTAGLKTGAKAGFEADYYK